MSQSISEKGPLTFGRWVGEVLSESNKKQLWVPPGFAHGFLTRSDRADFLYKTTNFYSPECERCIMWNDPQIGIPWPFDGEPLVSAKDARGVSLSEAEVFD
jgi:dTDP-4-dehydrorhamnose 3,5-epimerase